MTHLDFTIDFETCSLSANAAVMQVAVVPWKRDDESDPFFDCQDTEPFVGYVDLRTCVVEGFDFDPDTVTWWSRQGDAAKAAVTAGLPEPVSDVLINMLNYIRGIVKRYELQSICLWCQGTDLDIAILRNLCRKYDVDLNDIVPHTQFRDSRTFILEAAYVRAGALCRNAERVRREGGVVPDAVVSPSEVLSGDYKAYMLFEPIPERYFGQSREHDALYDAVRTSWNTWQALGWINSLI